MSTSLKSKFEELNMSQEEINRFTEAMKKEEFRKLLCEYAEEISDPKNRELYEQEITKLEQERGIDCTFIHPEPGYCVKTIQNGDKKCFINICKNSLIDKPSAKRDSNNNKGGLHWQIPHSCSPPRDDMDKSNRPCVVYDVVFNPDAYRMGETNQRFNQLLRDSAMDTIEANFNVILDKSNAKVLKNLNFKGRPTASVIRRRPNNNNNKQEVVNATPSDDPIEKIVDQLKTQYLSSQTDTKQLNPIEKKQEKVEDKYTRPNYKITYRGQADMQDYAIQIDNSNIVHSTRPKELFVSIELPLCKSSSNVVLDIFEKRLYLESNNPFYKLDLNLSYPVNEKESKAKFDKSKRCLNVTLPVIPFVAKLQHKFEDETLSYSSTSSSSSEEELVVEKSQNEAKSTNSDSAIKYILPTKFELKQSKTTIYLQIQIENFERKSVQISRENDTCVLLTCESLSTSGTYLTYYKAYINFLDIIIRYDQIKFINDDLFQVVFEATQDCDKVLICSKYTDTKPNEMAHDVIIVDRVNEVVLEVKSNDEEEQEQEVNKMSKKDYIVNFENISKQNDLDDDDDDEDKDEYIRSHLISSTSSSCNDLENGSSLSSSMNSCTLKGILKKPRSISEGEGSLRSSFESNNSPDGSNQELSSMKKSVSFNKQVVRNVFKPGSTITGMKRPNSNKNKKKNQKRNRTISDPSHNADNGDYDDNHQVNFRSRSFSESSDDSNFVNMNTPQILAPSETAQNKTNSKKKKKNVRIGQVGSSEQSKRNDDENKDTEDKTMFNMEKMIQMKSQGVLPSDDAAQHRTSCAFKIKNKIADDLD